MSASPILRIVGLTFLWLALLATWIATLEAAPALQTYHVAVRKDGRPGTGTPRDPFDASTSAKLDALMASFAGVTNLRFVFGPGTYHTSTGIDLGNDWIVEGAGETLTIFKWNDNTFVSPTITPSWMFRTTGGLDPDGGYASVTNQTFSELRNFTIDSNLSHQPIVVAQQNGYVMAYNLVGMYLTVEHVRVMGTYCKPGEQFPCTLGVPYRIGDGTGLTTEALRPLFVTRHVTVTDCRGTAQSVISHTNWSKLSPPYANVWLDSRMEDCVVRNGPAGAIAFGGGGWSSHKLLRCRAYNVQAFSVWDTGRITETTVEHCVGEGIGTATAGNIMVIGGHANQVRGLVIRNNRFALGRGGGQVCVIASSDMTDTVFEGNRVDASGSKAAGQYFVAINCNAPGGRFVNNIYDTVSTLDSRKMLRGWEIKGNKTTAGKPMPDLGREKSARSP